MSLASCFFSFDETLSRSLFVFDADCKSRAEAFPPRSGHRFCSPTIVVDAIDTIKLFCDNEKEGKREVKEEKSVKGHVDLAQTAAFFREQKKKKEGETVVPHSARPRGGVPGSPRSALRRKGARESKISRYVVN